MAMILYGIGILLLFRYLQETYPLVTQLLYSDNTGVGGFFRNIQSQPENLMVRAVPYGYFLEPTKSILVGTCVIQRHGIQGGERKPVPWGIHQRCSIRVSMDEGEVLRVVRGGRDTVRGSAPSSEFGLCRDKKCLKKECSFV